MPPRSSRPQYPGHVVTAVVVSHDGDRWLPGCLDALAAQTRPPQRVVAVDTGSTDSSPAILAAALGDAAVVRRPRETALGAAVQAGLDAFDGAPAPPGTRGEVVDWVWVLHDDCAPDPTALAALLSAAVANPSVAVFGPKVVAPDGRRLREVGLTIDSSGRVRTGLEPREVDQGQHDDVGDVLAVGTAGMLVRRRVWDAVGGLDPAFPWYADDVDFGWRLNAAGERVRVVPGAVVRHTAAMRTGVRRPAGALHRPGVLARRAGRQVVLANTATWLVPLLMLRWLVETVLGAVGDLLLRRPGDAFDLLLGTVTALSTPRTVVAARRRRSARTVPHGDLRPLLARPGLRVRDLGDAVAAAVGGRAVAEDRSRRRAPVETGPVADDAQPMDLDDSGVLLRMLRRPGVVLLLVLTGVGLLACRDVLGGLLFGGRLLPAPPGAADLWSAYTAGWHPVGLGSTATAPPSLAVLALAATVLLGKAWLLVAVLLLGAVPLAGVSAYLALRPVTASTRVRVWAAATYAVLPVVTGAVSGGRLDVIVVVILLPPLARALARTQRGGASWHGGVAAGLLLAVVASFAPIVWVIAVAAVAAAVAVPGRRRARAVPAVLAAVVPLVVLLPWTWTVATHGRLLLAGAGLPEVLRTPRPAGPAELLLLHPGGPAQPPTWLLAPVVVAALVGVVRRRSGGVARAGYLVFLLGVTAALVTTRVSGAGPDPAVRYWPGAALAVAGLGALVAAAVALDRARTALSRHSFGWRQPSAAVLAAALLVASAWLGVAWLVRGAAGPLESGDAELLPVFAAAEIDRPTSPRVVVLRTEGREIHYALLRDSDGPRLGDAEVADPAMGPVDRRLADAVEQVAAGQSVAVPTLVGFGVTMLVVPSSEAAGLGKLADVDGLDRVPSSGAVVWRIGPPTGELLVLPPADAARALDGAAVASATAVPLAAHAGTAHTNAPAGPTGRLLVLAEPADSAWRATLDGQRLAPTRAYGWAQAWRLPASAGRLEVSRGSGGRGLALVGQLVAVVAAVALAAPRARRDDDEPVAPAPSPVQRTPEPAADREVPA